MRKRFALVLSLAFALTPLIGGVSHAGSTCDTVNAVGTKLGIFPLGMHQEEVEEAWHFVCANTP